VALAPAGKTAPGGKGQTARSGVRIKGFEGGQNAAASGACRSVASATPRSRSSSTNQPRQGAGCDRRRLIDIKGAGDGAAMLKSRLSVVKKGA